MKTGRIGIGLVAFMLCALAAFAQEGMFENLKFKDADIRIVLQAIAEQASKAGSKINIVTSPDVRGLVSIDLEQVYWETALNVLLKANNYGSYRYRNVITVAPLTTIQATEKSELEKQSAEYSSLKVFKLKYIDANDAKKAIEPMLTKVGRVSVLETTGQSGWAFGMGQATKIMERKGEKLIRAKVLIVSDIPAKIDQIGNLLDEIDVMAKQILIKARIMEVSRGLLKDIGFDWGTGATGGTSENVIGVDVNDKGLQAGGHSLATVTPSAFIPQSTGLTTANAGLKLLVKHLTGTQFEVILHALEENAKTNMLSAPILVTLNNQEASILIGTKFPIIKTDISTQTNYIIGGSLQEYQDIGIQLNVVPQIWGPNDEFINMIVHPAISSSSTTEKVISQNGTVLVQYPVITIREAETQLVVKDGETVVMGGLLKDVKTKEIIGVPFLSKIPLIGKLFQRETNNTEKVDLLIFITAQIIKPGELLPREIVDVEKVTKHFPDKVTKDFKDEE